MRFTHRYLDLTLEPIGDPHDLMVELVGRLEDSEHMFMFGTALGLWRDGKLIPTDTDIDVGMTSVDVMRSRFAGWDLAAKSGDQYLWYVGGVVVDVHVWSPGFGEWQSNDYLLPDFDPQPMVSRYGFTPIPTNPDEYLTGLYGDWRTPT